MTLAFNNDPAQAERIRAQVLAHEAHDEIVQGTYWQNGKGCFIGCIAHSSSAEDAAGLLGGDLMLIKIAEDIFEDLPNIEAKRFPARVMLAPRVGADLALVPWKFLHWCVTDALTHADQTTRTACDAAVAVLAAKAAGLPVSSDAAYDAAFAARAADAAARAADAARAAARATAAAHRAAYDATHAAAYAADAACDAARAAAYAAASVARIKQADKLIELLGAA